MNIFVGHLAFSTTDHDLRQLCEPYGAAAEIRVSMDRETGRSKGFGFVEMPDGTAARTAMATLQGHEVEGRTLTVHEAKPREPRRESRQVRGEATRPHGAIDVRIMSRADGHPQGWPWRFVPTVGLSPSGSASSPSAPRTPPQGRLAECFHATQDAAVMAGAPALALATCGQRTPRSGELRWADRG